MSRAADAMGNAAALAPQSWSLVYRYGVYAEAAGESATAQQAYAQAVGANKDIVLLPEWGDSPLRRAIPVETSKLSEFAQAILALEHGDLDTGKQVWESFSGHSADVSSYHVVNLMIALAEGDRERASAELQAAQHSTYDRDTRAWVYFGAALLDEDNFEANMTAAREELDVPAFGADWELGANIAYIQYLQLAIPRQFLPQVGYSEADAVLLHLLGDGEALANLRANLAG